MQLSLDQTKTWLGVQSTADDALLTTLITGVCQAVESFLNRNLDSQAYSKVLSGNGKSSMQMPEYPLTAVSSLKIGGVSVPPSSGYYSPGYAFTEREIYLRGYSFTRGQFNVEVSFTAGYVTVPDDVQRACLEIVALRYKEKDRIGHQSKSIAGETVSFFIKDMPDFARTILNNYRKVAPL